MNIQVLTSRSPEDVKEEMIKIGVSPYGIKEMLPKSIPLLIKLGSIDFRAANILKQEMLSLGGEAAIPRGALDGSQKETPVMLIGNQKIFSQLLAKLLLQPFGLKKIGSEIDLALKKYSDREFVIRGRHLNLKLGKKTCLMGILNLTPDSFYDGGKYNVLDSAIQRAEEMVAEGADIIDVGGESTRPGARPVSIKEELQRVIPVVKGLRKRIKKPISVDTCKSKVARLALDSGANIVNDITALRGDKEMAKVLSRKGAPVILMHMQGRPQTMQKKPVYRSVISEIIGFLRNRIKKALEDGISFNKIIIDPGIGFGKTVEHNLEIFSRLREFKILGRPILVGPSRKSVIEKILNLPLEERLEGTAALVACSILNGVQIIRVHDVKEMVRAARMAEAIK
ncbi:MAG: dihydropteroate synthase [Candidatus Ratteibacteria bacterium]|nr:dihydropteroate synthase [Candidatus Ratteibacteria bacterium]